jgi:prepilin-type N-terminal cleavage/methylation domain-containing protein
MKNRTQSSVDREMGVRARVSPAPGREVGGAPAAFTLLELLVVLGIIALLAGIALPVMNSVKRKGALVRELNAGRQIMAAYSNYAAANDGNLLPGYDATTGEIIMPGGRSVTGIMCARYPWRLAPYIGGDVDQIFLVNDSRRKTTGLPVDSFDYQYSASLYPAFGVNAYCVGGYKDSTNSNNFSTDCVKRLAGTSRPGSLIVFASARYIESPDQPETPGFHLVVPPKLWRTEWTTPFDRGKAPSDYGNVDPRWDGKALCAFLDGHVALLGEDELTDMRYWSNTAAENDDRNFFVPR